MSVAWTARGVVLAIVLVVALSLGAMAGVAGVTAGDAVYDEHDLNESPYHEHPDEYEGDGDRDAIRDWLGGWMSGQLSDSVIEVTEGEADRARELLGDDFADRLSQFAEVSDEDDDEPDVYDDARDDHERFVELYEQYNETWAAYEAAVAAGDTEEAHALAREINDLADEILELTGRMLDRVEIVPLSEEAIEHVEETRDRVSEDQEQVQTVHFYETELTVEAVDATASFVDPAIVSGTLTDADGDPVANRSIELVVGETTHVVDTDADGSFTIEYRPMTRALDATNLTVAYVPDPASEFLASEDTVALDIEQVTPDLAVDVEPDAGGFGEELIVTGSLAVEAIPVDGVDLEIVLGGQAVGTATVSDGHFETAVTIPGEVPAGTADLSVRLPLEDRALASVVEVTEVEIDETETAVDLTADVEGDELVVEGGVETVDGQAVDAGTVAIYVDGEEQTEIGASGEFTERLTIPDDAGDNLTVRAAFDGTGTNLGDSDASVAVTHEAPATGPTSWWLAVAISVVLVVGAAAVWVYVRAGGSDDEPRDPPEIAIGSEPDATPSQPDPHIAEQFLENATAAIDGERYDDAVADAYVAARLVMAEHVPPEGPMTHGEYAQYVRTVGLENGLDAATVDRFEEVTDAFEHASFAPASMDSAEATAALEQARSLVS